MFGLSASPERNNLLFIGINYSSCCSAAILMDLQILSSPLWKVNVDRSHADLQISSLKTQPGEWQVNIQVFAQSESGKLLTLPCMHTMCVVLFNIPQRKALNPHNRSNKTRETFGAFAWKMTKNNKSHQTFMFLWHFLWYRDWTYFTDLGNSSFTSRPQL